VTREGETIRKIRRAVTEHRVPTEFTPTEVNKALGIGWAGVFLPKHRVGESGHNTELFVRIRPGLYKLKG
jgi:hypothetical protein